MRFIWDNFQHILPIVIFIIIAVSSVLGQKKRGEGDDIPFPPRSSENGEEADNGLRGTLEDIFEIKKPRPKSQPAPVTRAKHVDADIAKQKKIADRRAKEKAIAKGLDSAVALAYIDLSPQAAKTGEIAAYETATSEQSESSITAAARSGIVWAEILNRPVAIR